MVPAVVLAVAAIFISDPAVKRVPFAGLVMETTGPTFWASVILAPTRKNQNQHNLRLT